MRLEGQIWWVINRSGHRLQRCRGYMVSGYRDGGISEVQWEIKESGGFSVGTL